MARLLAAVGLVGCLGCNHAFGLTTLDDASSACPDAYAAVAGATTRFLHVPTAEPWAAAKATCESHSLGLTHLATFNTLAELVSARSVVAAPVPWKAWVGYGRDTGSTVTDFYAVTGEPLTMPSELWRPGEPNNGFDLFEELATSMTDDTAMNDEAASMTLGSLCACDGRPAAHMFVQ